MPKKKKKYWLVTCRFEPDVKANRYYMIIRSKKYEGAQKKFWKAMSYKRGIKSKVRGLSIYPMHHWPQNEDVYFIGGFKWQYD